MSAWGNLLNIFENPISDSLSSWPQLLPKRDAPADPSFEMFGELCHRVDPYETPPCPRFNKSFSWNATATEPVDANAFEIFGELCYKDDEPPPDRCTEGLGFESTVVDDDAAGREEPKGIVFRRSYSDSRARNSDGGLVYPPPISTIGSGGKPRVYFKSYRKDGRFVLKEVRIPTQQLLHSTRENGRLRMRVAVPDEDKIEGRSSEEEREEEGDGKERVSNANDGSTSV